MSNGINALIASGGYVPQFDYLGMKQNALRTRGMQRAEAQYPEELNWLRKQRTMEEQKFGMEKNLYGEKMKGIPAERSRKAIEDMIDQIELISFSAYPEWKSRLESQGLPKGVLKEPQWFEEAAKTPQGGGLSPEAGFKKYSQALYSNSKQAMDRAKTISGMTKVVPEGAAVMEPGREPYIPAPKTGKEEEKFGEPYIDKATGALVQKSEKSGKINKIATPPKGFVVESDGKGGFTIRYGTEKEMTAKTEGAIEEKIIGGKEQLARMQAIASEFKPEYQEIMFRLGAEWTGLKARLGQGVSKEDAISLMAFKKYQRKAIENINLYIHELTGAQMSAEEAKRLRLAPPDPGEKWYTGDDPITFKAKMDDVIRTTRIAIARYEYYLSKGFKHAEVKGMIARGEVESLDDILKEMKNAQ